MPLFSQVLELVDGRTPLIVEIKSYARQEELCQKTMALLEGYPGPVLRGVLRPPGGPVV